MSYNYLHIVTTTKVIDKALISKQMRIFMYITNSNSDKKSLRNINCMHSEKFFFHILREMHNNCLFFNSCL